MTPQFKNHFEHVLDETILNFTPITGGDISKAYRINTTQASYFLKLNATESALKIFKSEASSLKYIRDTKTIKTPLVVNYGNFENTAFLILEFIESKTPSSEDFKNLGEQLAKLHSRTANHFGFKEDNFIGSLSQSNKQHNNWTEFYIYERLLPQLELAKTQRLIKDNECPNIEQLKQRLKYLFEGLKPSLLHGDLWSGNYIISKDGVPYLIDPALYFGHHEVDIAMTKLFGGFHNDFYKSYESQIAMNALTPQRIEIYQLYYLLVHLNIFGRSYYGSVVSILTKYF